LTSPLSVYIFKTLRENIKSFVFKEKELSLKLQILMDRRAKIIQTLSNILKKISQTSDTIIANIK